MMKPNAQQVRLAIIYQEETPSNALKSALNVLLPASAIAVQWVTNNRGTRTSAKFKITPRQAASNISQIITNASLLQMDIL